MPKHVVLGLVLLLLAPALAEADGRDVFTVAAVPVDATAANANLAREQARADGEKRAYAIMLDRLTLASDRARLPAPTQERLNAIIGSFAVANEHTSSVRYLARYTFKFRPEAVRKLLRDAGVPFADTPSKALLVLPVTAGAGAPVLWDDPNPWRDAWNAHPPPAGLVPLAMPNGDLEDVQAIDAAAAIKGDPAQIAAVSQRYNGDDVLVAVATLDASVSPHTLAVAATRYAANGAAPPQSWSKTTTAAPDEGDAALFAAAVADTADAVEDSWKQANILDFAHSASLVATIPTGDLQHFTDVRDRLVGVPAIQKSELLSIDKTAARVEIHYVGDTDQLRTALAQRDLALEGQDPDWILERRAASPPP
ncbi:MAG TPA: DUF2066 domain-containing protein [Stellaceae bacterium]|nr:DUF2066 domain-containing protein [Stellaceae bacterium]